MSKLSGWQEPIIHAIGGLTKLGFDESGRYLLVVSHQDRGVIDLQSFKRIARDNSEQAEYSHYENKTVEGIGPMEGKDIKCVGLWGGNLKDKTSDDWHVSISDKEIVTLSNPYHDTVSIPEPLTALRAVGFSDDGELLIYATSSEIEFYRRSDNTKKIDSFHKDNIGIPVTKRLTKWEEWSGVVYMFIFIVISSIFIWHLNVSLNYVIVSIVFGLGVFLDLMSIASTIQSYYSKRNISGFFIIAFVFYFWAWLSYPHAVLFPSNTNSFMLWLYKIPDIAVIALFHLVSNISYGKKEH